MYVEKSTFCERKNWSRADGPRFVMWSSYKFVTLSIILNNLMSGVFIPSVKEVQDHSVCPSVCADSCPTHNFF